MVNKDSTEKKILHAARIIFQKKGMFGSRMQEIADEAGINKALLYYYFRSKEKLFLTVFHEAFDLMITKMNTLLEVDMPIFKKIEAMVKEYGNFLKSNPYLPVFIIYEMNADPARFISQLKKNNAMPQPVSFILQIEESIKKGEIKPIDPFQLLINIIALCVFPFAARPMLQEFALKDNSSFSEFIDNRQAEIAVFIINSIKP